MIQGCLRHHTVVCVMVLLLAACTNGGGDDGTTDTTAPTASVSTSPASTASDSTLIPENTVFTISFSETMNTSSLVISGDMAGESDNGVWSMTSMMNDTLVINPLTSWSAGTNRTLIINANDMAGNALATLTVIRDVSNGTIYYVDINMANDTGNGLTPATARRFIHTAVADSTPPATVLVRSGDYRLSHALNTHVVLKERVSLFGGYNADFTQRDPATNITTIIDRSTSVTGSVNTPHTAILGDNSIYPDPITPATVIDGFTILGSTETGADNTSAIVLYGASPTVQNNILSGGSGSSNSIGLYISNNSTARVLSNSINGGSSNLYSYGLMSQTASPILQNNTVHGGNGGSESNGIHTANTSSPILQNNLIYGGASPNSHGVYNINGASSVLQNNTLIDVNIVFLNHLSSPLLENNLLVSQGGVDSYCFVEVPTVSLDSSTPQLLRNNDFFNCAILYFDADFGCATDLDGDGNSRSCSVDEINALADIAGGVSSNISVDPQFIDIDGADDDINTMTDNNWHLSMFTPASVIQGGLNGIDQGWSFTNDKDGMTRPASGSPWSIGAYEPGSFDHADYIDNFTCATAGCHDGATPGVTGKSLTHADTTDLCEACHVSTAWVPAISPFDHNQVLVTAVCADCHDGSHPDISYKSMTHPETTDVCEGCHIETDWATYFLPVDHNQVVTTVCADCHDNIIASGKNTGHIPTNEDCGACHTTDSWLTPLP